MWPLLVLVVQESHRELSLSSPVQEKYLNPPLAAKTFIKITRGQRDRGKVLASGQVPLSPSFPLLADVQTPKLMGPSNFCSALLQ